MAGGAAFAACLLACLLGGLLALLALLADLLGVCLLALLAGLLGDCLLALLVLLASLLAFLTGDFLAPVPPAIFFADVAAAPLDVLAGSLAAALRLPAGATFAAPPRAALVFPEVAFAAFFTGADLAEVRPVVTLAPFLVVAPDATFDALFFT